MWGEGGGGGDTFIYTSRKERTSYTYMLTQPISPLPHQYWLIPFSPFQNMNLLALSMPVSEQAILRAFSERNPAQHFLYLKSVVNAVLYTHRIIDDRMENYSAYIVIKSK